MELVKPNGDPVPTQPTPQIPSVFAKVSRLMNDVGYIQKDSKNSFHKYSYLSHAQLMEKVQPALIANGLIVVPHADVHSSEGGLVTVKLTLQVVSIDDGSAITVIGLGSGQDAGDKAVMKAMTAAHKYAFMQLLCAPTGDDPEGDEKTDVATETKAAKPLTLGSQAK